MRIRQGRFPALRELLVKRSRLVVLILAVVFIPRQYHEKSQYCQCNRALERADLPKPVLEHLGNDTGENGRCSISHRGLERVPA